MDASRILNIAVVMGVVIALSGAVTTEVEAESQENPTTTEAMEATTTATTPLPEPPRNCTTARGLPGACAARQDCDYSTGPIDRSLYAPKGYKSSCKDAESCCPLFALVPEQPKTNENEEDSAFNDD